MNQPRNRLSNAVGRCSGTFSRPTVIGDNTDVSITGRDDATGAGGSGSGGSGGCFIQSLVEVSADNSKGSILKRLIRLYRLN